jgi:BirA family biotin operon repressor/biotin-[acetyl-CoA-carboxylase] ligase
LASTCNRWRRRGRCRIVPWLAVLTEQLQLPESIELVHFVSVESTNDKAKHLAAGGAKAGTLVWAGEQTRGRGRGGRDWHSPPGNLYCSIILRPNKPAGETAGLSFIAALAIADALEEFLPTDAKTNLKWPNDVLINGKKVAGILLESASVSGGSTQWVVIGCGVNVESYPENATYAVTSLAEEGCIDATVGGILEAYVGHLLEWSARWQVDGFSPVRDAWLHRATGLGKPIRVRLSDYEFQGLFMDMDKSGALLVELSDGEVRKVTAGDVFLVE